MNCYASELPKRNSDEKIIKISLKRVAQSVKISYNYNVSRKIIKKVTWRHFK